MKKLCVMLAAALLLALLSGCAFTDKLAQLDLPEPPGRETPEPTQSPEEAAAEQARQEELNRQLICLRDSPQVGASRRGHCPCGKAAEPVFL